MLIARRAGGSCCGFYPGEIQGGGGDFWVQLVRFAQRAAARQLCTERAEAFATTEPLDSIRAPVAKKNTREVTILDQFT